MTLNVVERRIRGVHEVGGNNGYWPSRMSGFQQSVGVFVVLIYMSDACHFPAFPRDCVFISKLVILKRFAPRRV
jgi:hypothetical protein